MNIQTIKIEIMKTIAVNNNGKTGNKPAFVNNNPVNKEAIKPEADKAATEDETVKSGEPTLTGGAPKTNAVNADTPKAEEPKVEIKPEPKKPALNLEETLKLVAELNRRKIQRDKLIETIYNLEAFEVDIKEDADETDGNIYQGCVLTIEDDNRRKFSTKNPVIIFTVAQQVNSMCVNKLAEIEAGIILPA